MSMNFVCCLSLKHINGNLQLLKKHRLDMKFIDIMKRQNKYDYLQLNFMSNNLDICRLPVESGPCDGKHHHVRWYFSEGHGTCMSFVYSGCGGNRNNFNSYHNCMNFCRERVITTKSRKAEVKCCKNRIGGSLL